MSAKSTGPQFVRFFGPVLDVLRALGGSGSPTEVADKVAEMLQIPQKQQEELTSSGQQRFLNRIQWARFYLSKNGLISSSERGVWAPTDKGRNKILTHEEALEVFELVDGQKLIEMFEHLQLGLKPIRTFEVDVDFFDDFREDAEQ